MPFRAQPFDASYTPPKYPAPDWDKPGLVTRVWVPEDETVGFLVRQGDALAWVSATPPDDLGYGVRRILDALLRTGAEDGTSADDTWAAALAACLHGTVDEQPLSTVTKAIADA